MHTCYMTLCFYYVIKDVGYRNLVLLAQDMLQKQESVILSTHYFTAIMYMKRRSLCNVRIYMKDSDWQIRGKDTLEVKPTILSRAA